MTKHFVESMELYRDYIRIISGLYMGHEGSTGIV